MRMLSQQRVTKRIKKSHLLLCGSFLVFIGVISLSWNYLLRMRDEVFSRMKIDMSSQEVLPVPEQKVISDAPIANNLPTDNSTVTNNDNTSNNNQYSVNYDKYLGVLEIPKIGLKRGFYNIDSKYNNIQYNVSMVKGSTLPDVINGNLILMAHSGDAYISYFAYLYKLQVGDTAYVTYNGNKYQYNIVNIYDVEKNGVVRIIRNYDKTTLTMITCTKDNDALQTVYIAELV